LTFNPNTFTNPTAKKPLKFSYLERLEGLKHRIVDLPGVWNLESRMEEKKEENSYG